MARTITVVGNVDAVNTRVLLTGQGSVTAPSLVVPAGMRFIKTIIASITSDGLADDGAACAFVRLGGNAVLNGEQSIFFGATGGQTVQAGSDAAPHISEPFILENADIEVRPGDTISIAAELGGVDPGDTSIGVTLIYGK